MGNAFISPVSKQWQPCGCAVVNNVGAAGVGAAALVPGYTRPPMCARSTTVIVAHCLRQGQRVRRLAVGRKAARLFLVRLFAALLCGHTIVLIGVCNSVQMEYVWQ